MFLNFLAPANWRHPFRHLPSPHDITEFFTEKISFTTYCNAMRNMKDRVHIRIIWPPHRKNITKRVMSSKIFAKYSWNIAKFRLFWRIVQDPTIVQSGSVLGICCPFAARWAANLENHCMTGGSYKGNALGAIFTKSPSILGF